METQVNQERIEKEIKKLEIFLKEFKVECITYSDAVMIYGKVYETIVNNPSIPRNRVIQIKIELSEDKTLVITPDNGEVFFDLWENDFFKTEIINFITNIIIEKDRLYIYF
jgi:hypothetical protein